MTHEQQLTALEEELQRLRDLTPILERRVTLSKYTPTGWYEQQQLSQNRNAIEFTARRIFNLQTYLKQHHGKNN